MGGARASLHDIPDAVKFARECVGRLRWYTIKTRLTPEQWDDMTAEGAAILVELAEGYDHHRPGYEHAGSFGGYAGQYLPLRLLTYWEKAWANRTDVPLHTVPEPQAVMHLGPMREDHLPDCPVAAEFPWTPQTDTIAEAIERLPAEYRFFARGVIKHTEMGLPTGEIATRLRVNRRTVTQVQRAFGSALRDRLRYGAA